MKYIHCPRALVNSITETGHSSHFPHIPIQFFETFKGRNSEKIRILKTRIDKGFTNFVLALKLTVETQLSMTGFALDVEQGHL